MKYTSTRNDTVSEKSPQVILKGLAPGGGLFVPQGVEKIDLQALRGKTYPEVAYEILKTFLPEYPADFLQEQLADCYDNHFGGKAGELVKVEGNVHALELWHGPTAAFKDYALQIMPRLLAKARDMLGQTGVTQILVATSGDTGKAALEGFAGVPGTAVAVFYPAGGTSEIQRLQMVTQEGDNVAVYGVTGNFDDAQKGVKAAFSSEPLAEELAAHGITLSSANSINWGRLAPQVVYYFTSYMKLCESGAVKLGDPIDFCVPTGNFGDIMAGWYAKEMGLPIGKLICASNKNNVLTDFINTGRYNAKRELYLTSSPSMDILVSSNLERLLYHTTGSSEDVNRWMKDLAETGAYDVGGAVQAKIADVFLAGWTGEEQVGEEIATMFQATGYLTDPHTAVAFRVAKDLGAGKERPLVVVSTASPFKFCGKVLSALGQTVPADEFAAIAALEAFTGKTAPASLTGLRGKTKYFTNVVGPEMIATSKLYVK